MDPRYRGSGRALLWHRHHTEAVPHSPPEHRAGRVVAARTAAGTCVWRGAHRGRTQAGQSGCRGRQAATSSRSPPAKPLALAPCEAPRGLPPRPQGQRGPTTGRCQAAPRPPSAPTALAGCHVEVALRTAPQPAPPWVGRGGAGGGRPAAAEGAGSSAPACQASPSAPRAALMAARCGSAGRSAGR